MNDIIVPLHFLVETPLASLYNNTLSGFDTPRKQTAGRVQINKYTYIAAPRINALGVGGVSRSSAKQYETKMYFENVNYLGEGDDQAGAFSFKTPDGQEYIIETLQYGNHDVKVSCTCLDFFYRFASWNHSDGSLFGKPPPPYQKKTDKPSVNPDGTPGLCKHLIALTDKLRQDGLLR